MPNHLLRYNQNIGLNQRDFHPGVYFNAGFLALDICAYFGKIRFCVKIGK
jgi:hypothetical protein